MKFQIESFVGAGTIRFDISPHQIRTALGAGYMNFKRTPRPAEPAYRQMNLHGLPLMERRELLLNEDRDLEGQLDGMT